VYLRVWNRGTDAGNVTATVYWSPPATLVTPNLWNLIGNAAFADVPPRNVVEVSSPGITWASANIPAPGHYCFVATAGNAADPAPNPGTFATFNEFVDYIYAHNNITWRNFNVAGLSHHRTGGFRSACANSRKASQSKLHGCDPSTLWRPRGGPGYVASGAWTVT